MIRKCIAHLLFICALLPTSLLAAEKLLQPTDFTYLGAFRVPQSDGLAYGGTALAHNPANNSLFIVGHDASQLVAEISVPANPSPNPGSMPTASFIQNLRDVTDGRVSLRAQGSKIGGLAVYNNQLIGTIYTYYDANNAANTSHFKTGTNLGTTNDFQGMYMVSPSPAPLSGSNNAGFVSGYMAPIPDNSVSGGTNWQTALGGPYLTGSANYSIVGRTSFGPAAFSFDPANLTGNSTASSLLFYDINHQSLGVWSHELKSNQYVSIADNLPGMVFPAGTQTIVFTGMHGVGDSCYGEASTCNDPAYPYKGTHAYPYEIRAYAYDAAYLAKVKAGATIQSADIPYLAGNPVAGQVIKPWNLKPYATWTLPLPTSQGLYTITSGSSAYDPNTKRFYVVQPGADNSPTYGLPLIHVFQVNTGASAPVADTTLPTVSITAPTNNATATGTVSVTATASDNVGVSKIEFYVNGTLKATDTATPYLYSWNTSSLAAGTYTLLAKAYDAAGNVGQSGTVAVTVVNDTAIPAISITAPGNNAVVSGTVAISASAADNVGVSRVEFYVNGTLMTAGNVAPYTGSWNTTSVANGSYTLAAKAYDAAGNIGQSANIAVTVNNPLADVTPPAIPANLTATAVSASQISLAWAASTDNTAVTGYKVFRNGIQVGTSAAATYQDAGLSANTGFSYAVAAFDAAGNASAQSTAVSATTQQLPSVGPVAGSACSVAALPITGTRIVNVATETQLQTAMSNLQSGDTIVLADGTYNLTKSLFINNRNNVTIRGNSGCDNVVLAGRGMDNANYGNVTFGLWSNSLNTTVANLTIRDTYDNAIAFNAGAQSPHIHSVKLLNAGSQFIKSNPTDIANGIGVNNAVIEYSWLEYTNGTPNHAGSAGYTNGISAHAVDGWTIRGNMFKNIHTPDTATYLWNPAVLMWNHSKNTITENNVFINVDRAVAYGLQDNTGSDHTGGVIRNNFVYLAPGLMSASRKAGSDAAIIVWDSPASAVYHNTILTNGNITNSIEYRFATTGAEARNNLADAPIRTRDSAVYAQSSNYLGATSGMFTDSVSGNLHLLDNAATRASVIDKAAVLTLVPTDIDGSGRPSGLNADIGADELVSVSASDTVAPTASVSAPDGNSTVSGTITVAAAVSDNTGVSKVEFYVSNVLQATDTTTPYGFSWNTTAIANGSYALSVKAYDAAGNVGQSSAALVTVNNVAADTTAPAVSISSPVNNATVSGSVAVSTSASDSVGVGKVEFYVNGILQAADTAAPYAFTWNTATLVNGSYSLTAKAYDTAGNAGASSATVVTVSNPVVQPVVSTIWSATTVPGVVDSGPDRAVELGMKFRSDVNGSITGIRFYKASSNTGTHVANLWTRNGKLLATATFKNETASGWQQADFTTPVAITANTVYVASYHTNAGHYSYDLKYFAGKGVDNGPLHALADRVAGYSGVYAYGSASKFPSQGWNSSNYWVDVVFKP